MLGGARSAAAAGQLFVRPPASGRLLVRPPQPLAACSFARPSLLAACSFSPRRSHRHAPLTSYTAFIVLEVLSEAGVILQ